MQATPTPPSLMRSLTAGFDAITRHIGLILFSIALDLLLWFGPQVRLIRLVEPYLKEFNSIPEIEGTGSLELLVEGFQRLNLLSILRTFPVGIPSLIALRAPLELPLSLPPSLIDLSSPGIASILWITLTLTGIGLGTLYFSLISQVSRFDSIDLPSALARWPRQFAYVLLLSLFWIISLFIFMLPMSCLMSISLMVGIGAGQFPLWIALFSGAVIVWFVIPLFFSPHGIIASHSSVLKSIFFSIRISRSTFSGTLLFVFIVGLISQGLNILWSKPADDSWFLMIGVFGHAFVNAGLVSATFMYYRDAEIWLKHWDEVRQAKLA